MEKVEARVLRVDEDSHKFIVEYRDRQFRISQFKYQYHQDLPPTVHCIYEEHPDGRVNMRQDTEYNVRQFYAEGDFAVCTVVNVHSRQILLEEERGFVAVMPLRNDISRATTQKLLCKIEKIGSVYMQVSLSKALNTKSNDMPTLAQSLTGLSAHREVAEELAHIIHDTIAEEREQMVCHDFVCTLHRNAEAMGKVYETIQGIFSSPTTLPSCATLYDRSRMERRLSMVISQVDLCVKAAGKLAEDKADDYAQGLFASLTASGYCHKMDERLYTLLFLFRLNGAFLARQTPALLATLRAQPLTTWQRRPYDGLLVRLLQCYVDHAAARQQHFTLSLDEKRLLIQVIAMQTALDPEGKLQLVDTALNKAMLYRLCAEMKVNDPARLLEHALLHLMSEPTETGFVYNQESEDVDVTANILLNQIAQSSVDEVIPEVYQTDRLAVSLTPESVVIAPLALPVAQTYQPLRNMGLAHNLDIRLAEKLQTRQAGNAATSIEVSRRLWSDIDTSLFSDHPVVKQKKRSAEPGMEVYIIVTHQIIGEDPRKFGCRIIDDEIEGTGTLAVPDIVGYYPGEIDAQTFMHEGHPLVLPAVIKQVGQDGSCVFSMAQDVKAFVEDYEENQIHWDTRMTCILNTRVGGIARVPGVTSEGFPISVEPGEGVSLKSLTKGKIVEVSDVKMGPNGYLNATYAGESTQLSFNFAKAFHQFMILVAGGDVYTEEEEEQEEEQEAIMDDSHARELLRIVDSLTALEPDYMHRYNHLGFCRTLAKVLGLDDEVSHFDLRMRMIEGLKFFEKNRTVDQTLVAELQQQQQTIINRRLRTPFGRLRVLSYLNAEIAPDVLNECVARETDKHVRNLASLVVSHNFVKQMGLFEQAEDIMEKIFELLNLKWTQSTKKYYGAEDDHTEFKQSIIYPAGAMTEDVDRQMHVILKVVCSFLNYQGGRLYIGVNDPGYETGIANDLKHKLFNGDLDKYKRYITNAIIAHLGQEADHYVRRMEFDKDVKSQVLMIDIDPCPTPVSLDGTYYERHGSTSQPLHEPYLSKFLAERAASQQKAPAPVKTAPKPAAKTEPAVQTMAVAPAAQPQATIATSTKRNNVLHDYEQDYQPTAAYIGFLPHAEYCILKEEDWDDYSLKLAVHPEETEGWLLLVYTDGYVAKIDMTSLLEKDAKARFKRFADAELLFATVATDADTLALGMLDSKGNRYMRFDDVFNIEETTSMQSHGATLIKIPHEGIYYCDTLPIASVDEGIKRNAGAKSLGISMKTTHGKAIRQLFPQLED